MSVNSHFLNLDTDVTLSSNSDTIIPSQKAIKTYADNKLIFFGTSTTAKATVQKEVSIPSITSLETGTIIVVQPTITSTVANSTIKLNNFDAYPMLYNNAAITTDTDSVVWNANYPCMWVFDGSNWRLVAKGLDSNSTYNMDYLNDQGPIKIGGTSTDTQALSRYSLVMQLPDMSWQKITNTTEAYSTGTSKTVNTNGFLLPTIKYYNTTTIVVGGGTAASRTIRPYSPNVDLRYSTNCGDTPGWTLGDYIYLVGTISNGLFYLDTTTWWTNTLPSTNDGKYYIRVGVVVSDYSCSLLLEHPVYYHNGTSLLEYKVADNKQDVITDLATIRSGASAGSTALQPDVAASTYLPLAGGTMTGAIQWKDSNNRVCALQLTTDGNKNLDFGWDWATNAGAGCALRSTSHSESGYFYFFARNGSNTTQLRGTPAGSLQWGGSEVLRVNKIDGTTIKANSSNVIYVDQSALTDKQDTIIGGASSITSTDLTASRALQSDANGKVSVSSVTSTELGYLSGVTSAIQTQIDSKLSTSTAESTYLPLTGGTLEKANTTTLLSLGDGSAQKNLRIGNITLIGFAGTTGFTIATKGSENGNRILMLPSSGRITRIYDNVQHDVIWSTQKGAANGVATLDANTKVPIAQLPMDSTLSTSSTNPVENQAVTTSLNSKVEYAMVIKEW